MLYFLRFFSEAWGPFRMFGSHTLLIGAAAFASGLSVAFLLPKLWHRLPLDRGKALVQGGAASKGKPTGAGYLMFWLTLPALVLFLPYEVPGIDRADDWSGLCECVKNAPSWKSFVSGQWGVALCVFAAMLTGYFDDKSDKPWGRVRKGLLDLAVVVPAALFLTGFKDTVIWLPFTKETFLLSPFWFTVMAVPLLWFSINSTNCSDGVDGLAGSLTAISLFGLVAFLYGVTGHEKVAGYLLVPHNPEGARWAILCAAFGGGTVGYLWHNANPSSVLMGDAGSRALGLLAGAAVLATGNPVFIIVMMAVVLVNGGGGVLKLFILQVLARAGLDSGPSGDGPSSLVSRKLRKVRFPLHDHCRRNLGWSNAQVLMRFVIIQSVLIPLLFLLFMKIR